MEESLIDLRDWLAEQVWGRSLGLAILRPLKVEEPGGVAHGIELRSPFVTLQGPVFQLVGDRLVIATSQSSLGLGVELAARADTWQTPAWALAGGDPPDEVVWIRPAALTRILAAGSIYLTDAEPWLLEALGDLLAGSEYARVLLYYEEDGLRIFGRLQLDG